MAPGLVPGEFGRYSGVDAVWLSARDEEAVVERRRGGWGREGGGREGEEGEDGGGGGVHCQGLGGLLEVAGFLGIVRKRKCLGELNTQ